MKKVLLSVVVMLCFCRPSFCQLGLGGFGIVWDPKETIQVIAVLNQARQQMQFWQSQVQQLKGMVSQYQSAFAQLQGITPRDLYGNIGGLAGAANSNGNGAGGPYQNATLPVYAQNLSGLPSTLVRRFKTRYGDVEMSDGSNVAAWNLIGQVRSNAQSNSNSLSNLTSDSMLGDVTTLQVQQRSTAAMALAVQQLNTLQQVEAAQLEQSVERAQRERNAAAAAMAPDIALQNNPVNAGPAAVGNLPASGVPTLKF